MLWRFPSDKPRHLTAFLAHRRALVVVLGGALALSLSVAHAQAPVAVNVSSASQLESCAEKDNVTIQFSSAQARQFRIEAAHPAYIGGVNGERREPDWTDCSGEVIRSGPPPTERRITFYESPFLWVTGYEWSDYWRQRDVPVRVGGRVEHNLTMVQVWVFVRGKAEQVLVLYPTDGLWRLHPLPPPHLAWTSYGSSLLIGPVEIKQRPLVELKEISYDPTVKTFHLAFERGGNALVKLTDFDDDHILLDVSFDRAIDGLPFAALRSMYVTEFNADVARIAVQQPDEAGWLELPIMNFRKANATKVWMGRLVPSRHNISAPDMVFSGFSAGNAAQ
jgi:hypothetical protein